MVETFTAGPPTDEYAKGVRQIMLNGITSGGKPAVCNHKAQVITKSMLLGQLSGLLKCQPWEHVPWPRVQSPEKIHAKIEPILKAAPSWGSVFRSLKDQVKTMRNAEEARMLLPASRTLTPEQQAHLRGLKILSGARRSSRQTVYSYVERNLQHMAFMVHWHSTVSRVVVCGQIMGLIVRLPAQHRIPARTCGFFSTAFRNHNTNGVP